MGRGSSRSTRPKKSFGRKRSWRLPTSAVCTRLSCGRFERTIRHSRRRLHAAAALDEDRVAAERAFERGRALAEQSIVRLRSGARDVSRGAGSLPAARRWSSEVKAAIEWPSYSDRCRCPRPWRLPGRLKRSPVLPATTPREPRRSHPRMAYGDAGDRPAARRALEESVALSRAVDDHRAKREAQQPGHFYGQTGDAEQAAATFERTLLLTRAEGGGGRNEEQHLNNLGIAYKDLGQYDKALEFYEQALARTQAGRNQAVEVTVLNNMGNVQRLLGQHDKALVLHTRALAVSRDSGDRPTEARSLNTIGLTYYELGIRQSARLPSRGAGDQASARRPGGGSGVTRCSRPRASPSR